MTDYNTTDARNVDEVEDRIIAIREAEKETRTPFGDDKSAELDLQFTIDPSFGLTKERYGWYTNNNLFDSTAFTDEQNGLIGVETGATGTDTARIRSAYPGQYAAHTVAEPGMGLVIPSQHLEENSLGNPSLTHGEISAEVVEWNEDAASGENAIGLSFESDGIYVQVRRSDQNVEFTRQENWNLDPLDGTGPSGFTLEPEKGYVYNFQYSWYGQGGITFRVLNSETQQMIPFHRTSVDSNPPTETPNMPVQLTIENQGTADPLGAELGGLQFATYGSGNLDSSEQGRSTTVMRHTGSSYIDTNVVLSNNSPDPFAEPGVPLVSARREVGDLGSRRSLAVSVLDTFINSGGDVYLFIWDEWDDVNALTGENFRSPPTNEDAETRLEVDTEATAYSPSVATLRGILYVAGDKNTAEVITGDSSQRLPLDATTVVTSALPPGDNATYAQPAMLEMREQW